MPDSYRIYYNFLLEMFALHFCITYGVRLFLTNRLLKLIKEGKIVRKILIFGTGEQALSISNQLTKIGYQTIGFIRVSPNEPLKIDFSLLLETSMIMTNIFPKSLMNWWLQRKLCKEQTYHSCYISCFHTNAR
ncbi:MAG: hypothetical protein L6V92_04355 [Phocaeicola vulgatus]|nr:MAG: hypothetical protein L6V92_04355 [Phocaeicola vulgatus]